MRVLINNGRISPLFFSTRGKLLQELLTHGAILTITGKQEGCEEFFKKYNIEYIETSVSRGGTNPVEDLRLLKEYCKIMQKGKFDVVHSYTVKPNIYSCIAAKHTNIRKVLPVVNGLGYVFTYSDKPTIKNYFIKNANIHLYKKAFGYATNVFFQNSDDAEELVSYKAVNKEKCIIIPGSGIDLIDFPYTEPVSSDVFFFASRLLVTKGIDIFLEAAKQVKSEHPEAKFIVAGRLEDSSGGLKKERLDKAISDGYIEYIGHTNEMKQKLVECTAFVLPSYYREGIPHAILEAMSIGRSIITCNSPGCKETIKEPDKTGHGINGFLIEPRNADQLAERIRWMVENKQEVKLMGKMSREYAEEKFDLNIVNQKILAEIFK